MSEPLYKKRLLQPRRDRLHIDVAILTGGFFFFLLLLMHLWDAEKKSKSPEIKRNLLEETSKQLRLRKMQNQDTFFCLLWPKTLVVVHTVELQFT